MNREIKFRGRRLNGGGWIYGNLREYPNDSTQIVFDYDEEFWVDRNTVGQFTGLLDKNGREIWEGDIVTWLVNDISSTAPVEWRDGAFWMTTDINSGYFVANDWLRGEYQVVGSIHDNPELLNPKQS